MTRTPARRSAARRLTALVAALALVAAACGGGADDEQVTLRIAMGSPGEAQIAVWEAAAEAFEEANEHVTIEFNFQEPNLYETTGLPVLLNSNQPPDIYFEWAGERLRLRHADGFAADLSDHRNELDARFDDGAFNGMVLGGELVMVPSNADVTNVYWYNVEIFEDLGLDIPTTWDEFLDVCQAILDAGIIPIATGNRDLWPGGNWFAHQVSRIIGEDAYDAMMRRDLPMDDPSIAAALETAVELRERGFVNDSVAGVDDSAAAQLFFQGQAAMHPIGSWLVSWAIAEAPDLEFDYFNLPAVPGAGVQDSVIGVSTGHIVNANSEHVDLAVEFLLLFHSPEFVAMMVEAGGTPMARDALDQEGVDDRLVRLMDMMTNAGALVLPPDVGYDLEVAGAFNAAVAEVLGGAKTPEQALADAEAKLP